MPLYCLSARIGFGAALDPLLRLCIWHSAADMVQTASQPAALLVQCLPLNTTLGLKPEGLLLLVVCVGCAGGIHPSSRSYVIPAADQSHCPACLHTDGTAGTAT